MPAITTAILATAAIAGTAMSAYGAIEQSKAAKGVAQQSQAITQDQMQQNQLQEQAMELDNKRRQLQQLRQAQVARSMALTNATNQGAQFGSGLQGGYGQISGESNTNLLGLDQSLSLGKQNFALTNDISQHQIAISQYQSQAATASGISSLGGAVLHSLPTVANLAGGFNFGGGTGTGFGKNAYG